MHQRREFYWVTDRSFEEYKTMLKLPLRELEGKTVLDIGSGVTLKAARQAAEEGVTIFSINPALRYPRGRRRTTPLHKRLFGIEDKDRPPVVAGLVQELPIQSSSIDIVMSVFAMPYWIHNAERLQHGSEEIMRVLKDDGYASLYPIAPPRIDTTVQKRVMEDTIISLGGKFAVHKYDRRERIQIQAR